MMIETPPLLSLSGVLLRFRDDNEEKEKGDGGAMMMTMMVAWR